MSYIGQTRTIVFNGRTVPGVITGEPISDTVQVPSKDPARKGALINIPVMRAEMISLRETNPARGEVETYLTLTVENLRFTLPRFSKVVGLDVTADGELLDLQALTDLTAASMAEYQLRRSAATAEPEIDLA